MTSSSNSSFYYLDSNAVTSLWDKWTTYSPEGRTGDDIKLSPFSIVVLSEYGVAECITIPHTSNAYKKHLCLFSIFPKIRVFKPITIFDQKKPEHDKSSIQELLNKNDFLGKVAALRTSALLTTEGRSNLQKDLQHKYEGIQAAALESFGETASGEDMRLSLDDIIDAICKTHKLSPKESKYDFYQLVMRIYVAKRQKLIKGINYKKVERNLNEKIDSYHLSYLPYVRGFVTSDYDLYNIAQTLSKHFDLGVEVLKPDDFWSLWLRNHLLGNDK